MYTHETFPNAPLTEAMIDLRVTYKSDVHLDQLQQLSERCSESFPVKNTLIAHELAMKIWDATGSAESRATSKKLGYLQFTKNRDRAIQLRADGFAFSKLKPYESWSSLCADAHTHWDTYREVMSPTRIVRLAVRYINRIELELPITDFQDYIRTVPQIADGIPQGLTEFFFRVVVPNPDDDQIQAIITSTIEKPEQDRKTLPYIFDIDAFTPVDLDPSDEKLWPTLEKLRDFKNLIFFLSTTEKAKELFR